jgi:hypothetical protein
VFPGAAGGVFFPHAVVSAAAITSAATTEVRTVFMVNIL